MGFDFISLYHRYPDDDNVQYLHETYSEIISPLEGIASRIALRTDCVWIRIMQTKIMMQWIGVENEHFINWMRTAGLPNFRKLYGKIDSDFAQGDVLSFNLTLNFEVASYSGSKSLIVTTLGYNGR